MIIIDQADFIGKGLHRACYIHPHDTNRCIKITVNGDGKEDIREQKYYRLLQKRNITWNILPRSYGIIETNLGLGSVFDLIRDFDNSPSKTLKYYLEHPTPQIDLTTALDHLKTQMLQQTILTMSLKPDNILYQRSDGHAGKLIIIDNIGCSDFIPICHISTRCAKRKIMRKWQRFQQLLLRQFPTIKERENELQSAV